MDKYLYIFRLGFIQALKNYKSLIGLSIFLVTCLIIYAHIWKIASARIGAVHYTTEQLLWYIALNEWVLIALPDVQEDMEQDLQSGRLAYLLPRPISYLASTFCEGLGTLCVNLIVLGIVTFSFTWIRIGAIPFNGKEFIATIGIGCLAGCIGLIFNMVIGLCAFWLKRADPIHWVWEKLLLTLGGLMLPLAVYPEWLQKIALCTPFAIILGERSSLAIEWNSEKYLILVGMALFWLSLGGSLLLLLYRKGLKILNIEGG